MGGEGEVGCLGWLELEDRRRRVNGAWQKVLMMTMMKMMMYIKCRWAWQFQANRGIGQGGGRRGVALEGTKTCRRARKHENWIDMTVSPVDGSVSLSIVISFLFPSLSPCLPFTLSLSTAAPPSLREWQQFMLGTTVRHTLHKIHFRVALPAKVIKIIIKLWRRQQLAEREREGGRVGERQRNEKGRLADWAHILLQYVFNFS